MNQTCRTCSRKHTINDCVHVRGAYTYCMGCVPSHNAPHGIIAALKQFTLWLFSPLAFDLR